MKNQARAKYNSSHAVSEKTDDGQQKQWKAAIDVFSIAAFCVFTWSIIITLWDIPGLLLYMQIWDLIGYTAYQLMFALLESLCITGIVIGLSFLLPKRLMRKDLSASGGFLIMSLAFVILSYRFLPALFQWFSGSVFPLEETLILQQIIFGIWLFLTLFLLFFGIFIPPKERRSKLIHKLEERLHPLAGIYAFLGISSIFLVVTRNL